MPFDFGDYLNYAKQRESGGNPNAQNPNSSASGLFQFIDSTYLPYARQMNPGVSEGALLAKKNDPAMQQAIMERFTNDNISKLQQNGIEPTNGSAYLSHFLGSQGALKALLADPATPIDQVVNPKAIQANPNVFKNVRTAGDLLNWSRGGQEEANLPVANGSAAQFSIPGGGEPSKMDQFMAGGPGAFIGKPQAGWNAGEALQGAGIAMMARDDPKAAAALAQAMQGMAKSQEAAKIDTHYDPQSGMMYQVNQKTGQVQVKPMGERRGPEGGIREAYETHNKTIDTLKDVVKEGREIQAAIQSGKLAVDPATKAVTFLGDLVGNESEQSKWNARLNAYTEKLRNATLMAAKGVQTEGDAVRALNQLFPGSSGYNAATVMSQLDNITGLAKRDIGSFIGKNKQSLEEFKGSRFSSSSQDPARYDSILKDLDAPSSGSSSLLDSIRNLHKQKLNQR